MRRALILAAAIGAIVAPPAAAKSFLHGVAAGEVTPTSAVLWTRFAAPGVRLRVEVARDRRFRRVVRRASIFGLSSARDRTVAPRVPHLRPATTYYYRFLAGRLSSPVGRFRLFFLDELSFRSAKASAGPECRGAGGSPDLAPTAPQAVGTAFASLAPCSRSPSRRRAPR